EMLLFEAEASQALPRDARHGETSGKMKQFASWFTHGVPGGAKLRASIYQARTGAEVLAQVDCFFQAQAECGTQDAEEPQISSLPDFPQAAFVCD
ncbi:MAG: hypothetical protein ACRD2D_05530, partial [Terriglobales bacterium]